MASYVAGFEEKRFVSKVDRNFICLICSNVLKDPVLCPGNHHCFCRACITKRLENSQKCPRCDDQLTVETLAEPQRMIKQMLNELNIHCVYVDKGCQEIVQLQKLDSHEATCGFMPAVCKNQGCGATLNQRDLIHHESEVCEFRKLKCHSCGEMTKTLTDMEKRIETVETNMALNLVTTEAHMKTIQTTMATNAANVNRDTADLERKLEAVNKKVTRLETTLIQGFDEIKDVLAKLEDKLQNNPKKVLNTPSTNRDNFTQAGYRESSSRHQPFRYPLTAPRRKIQ